MSAAIRSPSSLSSLTSADLLRSAGASLRAQWSTLETVGRSMLLFSVGFFVVGVFVTVLGFASTGLPVSQRLPMQIMGPALLASTGLMWLFGTVFSCLWTAEARRQRRAIEAEGRLELHRLAVKMLLHAESPEPRPTRISSQDSNLRREMLIRLHNARYWSLLFIIHLLSTILLSNDQTSVDGDEH